MLHFKKIVTTCPGVGTALEGGFDRRKGRFWCAASNSVNQTCSTSTLLGVLGQQLAQICALYKFCNNHNNHNNNNTLY